MPRLKLPDDDVVGGSFKGCVITPCQCQREDRKVIIDTVETDDLPHRQGPGCEGITGIHFLIARFSCEDVATHDEEIIPVALAIHDPDGRGGNHLPCHACCAPSPLNALPSPSSFVPRGTHGHLMTASSHERPSARHSIRRFSSAR